MSGAHADVKAEESCVLGAFLHFKDRFTCSSVRFHLSFLFYHKSLILDLFNEKYLFF